MVNPQDADNMKESPMIVWLRDKLSSHPISKDQDMAKAADAVSTSSDTVHMAEGGEVKKPDSDYGTLVGLRELLKQAQQPQTSTDTVHMADGGSVMDTIKQTLPDIMGTIPGFGAIGPLVQAASMKNQMQQATSPSPAPADPNVDQDFMAKLNQGMDTNPNQVDASPSAPPIQDVMQTLNKTPATNYDFYKNMSAEDRAALMSKLTQQQHSGGNLLASGAAGLGDAIARSFGGQHTDYQKGVEEGAQKAKDEAVGTMDTQRTQKLQDVTANQQSEMDDPNSRLSMTMRETFKSAGINVPSGMPASVMMKIAPDIGNLALKQAVLQQTGAIKGAEMAQRGAQMQTAAAENAANHPIQSTINQMTHGKAFPAMNQIEQAGGIQHGIPDLGDTFNGQKIVGVKRIS